MTAARVSTWSRATVAAVLALSLGLPAARAQVSVTIGLPAVSIGVRVPIYPALVQVPGYPVYYDPHASTNYFFYDGLYWVYQGDAWYQSAWYDGPWQQAGPESVPLFVLRVPVRYYRSPPGYFRGWQADAPPRWGEHWGRGWEQRRAGWDRWDRRAAPAPAPLPAYQRQYAGDRYPRALKQQHELHARNYPHGPQRGHEPQPEQKAKGQEGRRDQGEKGRQHDHGEKDR